VHGALYSRVDPEPVVAPRLIAYSPEVATLLGITAADVASPEFARIFSGNALLDGMQPYAANYGGHQFGNWAGQLGDGRAITLGETINAAGERWELQLKGAGPTPYARTADGRAVLRSSIREFLCSEAMHHLGVPTTRALCLVGTGEQVERDMFYDGHPRDGRERSSAGWHRLSFASATSGCRLPRRRALDKARRFHDSPRFPGLLSGNRQGVQRVTRAIRGEWFAQICERTACGRALDACRLRAAS
jgi:hypothetical protein